VEKKYLAGLRMIMVFMLGVLAVSNIATAQVSPQILNSTIVVSPIDACSTALATINLQNTGQATGFDLEVTEELPPGLLFVSGSVKWRLNGAPGMGRSWFLTRTPPPPPAVGKDGNLGPGRPGTRR